MSQETPDPWEDSELWKDKHAWIGGAAVAVLIVIAIVINAVLGPAGFVVFFLAVLGSIWVLFRATDWERIREEQLDDEGGS